MPSLLRVSTPRASTALSTTKHIPECPLARLWRARVYNSCSVVSALVSKRLNEEKEQLSSLGIRLFPESMDHALVEGLFDLLVALIQTLHGLLNLLPHP